MDSVSVIGLGKLGAPLAAAVASKGLRVIGVDVDAAKVDAINSGRAPVFEPGLEKLIRESSSRLSATTDVAAAVAATDITFIVVATPSEADGGFSLRYVLPICEAIGRALAAKPGFHLVVLTSTVMPGATAAIVRPALEKASGKVAGRDFGLCYSPEFIALGSVIRDFLHPDFVLIGESDPRAGDMLESLYRRVCENSPRAARMNFVNAEITKLSVNTFVTTKISFANMLARICEALPQANVDVVTAALGLDSRIGAKYLKGAVSYGGPCFPRDNRALAALAQQIGAPADLARATDQFNRSQILWLADAVQHHAAPAANGAASPGAIGILGLTYKPQTDVVEQAFGFLLADELARRGARVIVYDPEGAANSRRSLDPCVHFAPSAAECIAAADVIVVATPWPQFAELPPDAWSRPAAPRMVIDCWRALNHLAAVPGLRYLSLGIGGQTAHIAQAAAAAEGPGAPSPASKHAASAPADRAPSAAAEL